MRSFTTKLSNISRQRYLRSNYHYRKLFDVGLASPLRSKSSIPLSEALQIVESPKVSKGILDDEMYLIDMRNVEQRYNHLIDVDMVSEIGSDKTFMQHGDIAIPKMQAYIGKMFLNLNHSPYLCSTEFIEYTIKKELYHPLFLYYVLNLPDVLSAIKHLESGKAQRRSNPEDLLLLKLPCIPIEIQLSCCETIKEIENQIDKQRLNISSIQSIIDEVFASEFGFDYSTFEKLKTKRNYSKVFSAFANNPDLRFSAKYHREAGEFVLSQLCSVTDKKIKHFLAEPIVLGAGVSPSDFDENGEVYYVSMATIKTYEIELDETQLLSPSYYATHKEKKVQVGDIIVARSGVAIGKTALVREEIDGVFADFIMRIRLKDYNPLFAYYYFRTTYFQYLIEIYSKGLQNKNIFPIVMQEFPLIDISRSEQDRIVGEIQKEIDKQTVIKSEIENLRKQIDEVIRSVL